MPDRALAPRTRGAQISAHAASCLLVAIIILCAGAGCVTDPTELAFNVTLKNDLRRDVTLRACNDANCESIAFSQRMGVGEAIEEGVSYQEGVINQFLIETEAGKRLGCLPLVFHSKRPDMTIPLSKMRRCPGAPITL
jgi:hypothetical protein